MQGKSGLIYIEIKGLREAMAMLQTPPVRRAARATLAEMTKLAKTEASTGIRARFNIKKKDLDPRMRVKLPTYSSLTGELTVSGPPIPLIYFGAKQISRAGGRVSIRNNRGQAKMQKRSKGADGVTYQVEKTKATLPHAFIAWHKSWGRWEVFQRKGKGRFPLRTFRSITVPSMFEQPRVLDAVRKRIQDAFDGRFFHHLTYFMNKGGK